MTDFQKNSKACCNKQNKIEAKQASESDTQLDMTEVLELLDRKLKITVINVLRLHTPSLHVYNILEITKYRGGEQISGCQGLGMELDVYGYKG